MGLPSDRIQSGPERAAAARPEAASPAGPLEAPAIADGAWNLTFDAVPDLIAVIDAQRRFVRVNRAMADRLDCHPGDLLGECCHRRVHGQDEPPDFCPVTRLLGDRAEATAEFHEEWLDGDFIATATPIRDDTGQIVGSVHIMREVTETLIQQRRLREHDHLQARFADAHDDLVFIKDAAGRYLMVNEAMAGFFGLSKEEIVGRTDPELMPPEAAERCHQTDLEAMEGDGLCVAEEEVDGRIFETRKSGVDLGEAGSAVVGRIRDVTERRTADQELARNEQRFRALFDHSLNAVALHEMVLDDSGRPADYVFVAANPAFAAMTGLAVQDIIGQRVTDVVPGIRETGLIERYGQVAATGRPDRFEMFMESLGRHYDIAAFSPAPGTFATAFSDVTEQELADERLRTSEEKFRLAMDAARLGIYDWDVPSGAIYYSPGYADMLGCRQDELDPTLSEWKRRLNDTDREGVLGALDELLRGDTDRFEWEYRLRTSDDRWIWVLEQGRVVEHADDGSPLRAVGTISDITVRRNAQEDLQATSERLRRTVDGTVAALGAAVESKDPYTAGHERRVAELACAIAAQLGLEEEVTTGLRLAATMHDLGKIAVPAEILSKPGRLSDIEMTLVRHHAQVGHDIIAGIEFDRPVADIVWQHHERLDGSGYPRGLHAEQILLEARVLAVADVVEAMMSHRPYRPARPIRDALDEIAGGAGVLYDPDACAACRRLFLEMGFAFVT